MLKNAVRSHDVIENKGKHFWALFQSHDVDENKGSYARKATMLLKTKKVGWVQSCEAGIGI